MSHFFKLNITIYLEKIFHQILYTHCLKLYMLYNTFFFYINYQILCCALFYYGFNCGILKLKHPTLHDTLLKKQPCCKVVASRLIALIKKGGRTKSGGLRPCADRSGAEKVLMDMYEVLSLLFLGGTFLIALLAYIDSRVNKRK